jgi:hypothetical protein
MTASVNTAVGSAVLVGMAGDSCVGGTSHLGGDVVRFYKYR